MSIILCIFAQIIGLLLAKGWVGTQETPIRRWCWNMSSRRFGNCFPCFTQVTASTSLGTALGKSNHNSWDRMISRSNGLAFRRELFLLLESKKKKENRLALVSVYKRRRATFIHVGWELICRSGIHVRKKYTRANAIRQRGFPAWSDLGASHVRLNSSKKIRPGSNLSRAPPSVNGPFTRTRCRATGI